MRENEGVARLQVVRTGSAQRALTFTWTLHTNSARAGEDFADLGAGVERIPAGVRRTVLTVPLVSDSGAEPTEMFLVDLQLEDGVQATLGERSSATVIIVDDD